MASQLAGLDGAVGVLLAPGEPDDASTQVIFRGNVEAWPVNFTKSLTDASTELVVRDFLALLGTSRLPASVVE